MLQKNKNRAEIILSVELSGEISLSELDETLRDSSGIRVVN